MALVYAVVLLRREDAPERRLHAQCLEVIAGDQLAIDALGLAAEANRERRLQAAEDVGERRRLLLEILVHGV